MTHVTCRLTAYRTGINSGNLRSAIEYGLPFYGGGGCAHRPVWVRHWSSGAYLLFLGLVRVLQKTEN